MVTILKLEVLFAIFICQCFLIDGFMKNLTPEESLKEDILLEPVEIMTKYGHSAEKHSVTTEDGYILELHRMLPKNNNHTLRNYPAFIMHGLASSSFDWLTLGPGKSIVYLLNDEGFDVWLGNARGNRYSRNHARLNPNETDFWKFSWHEIGYYDLPASIDYVLAKTNSNQLHYTGHSQGTTSFFVMCSTRPEYNDKIRTFNALAPPVFMSNAKFVARYAAVFTRPFYSFVMNKNLYEVPATQRFLPMTNYYLCRKGSPLSFLCESIIYFISGQNGNLNKTIIPLITSHAPAGFSILQMLHYAQEMISGKFRRFDHGRETNKKIYGSSEPPDYDLSNVKAPVALHYGDNDVLVAVEDVKQLRGELPNVILFRKVPLPEFNHLDFLFGVDVKKHVYDSLIKLVKDRD